MVQVTKSWDTPVVLPVLLAIVLVCSLHGKGTVEMYRPVCVTDWYTSTLYCNPPPPLPPVVSGQQPAITSSLPAAFFTASSAVDIAEDSVLQLFCTADSSDAVFTWDRGGTVLINDPPHICIRSNNDTNAVTSILTVDGFTTADNGAYQCSVGTAMANTQMLTGNSAGLCLYSQCCMYLHVHTFIL